MAVAFLHACPQSAPLLGTNPCSLPDSQFQGFTAVLTLSCPFPILDASQRQHEPEFTNSTEIIYMSLSEGGLGAGAVFPKQGLCMFP